MRIREHRELLEDSMKTMQECEPTLEAIAKIVGVPVKQLTVDPYANFADDRIGWDRTYLIMIHPEHGTAYPWGMADGPARKYIP